jgi:hypothetical protein
LESRSPILASPKRRRLRPELPWPLLFLGVSAATSDPAAMAGYLECYSVGASLSTVDPLSQPPVFFEVIQGDRVA